MATFSLVDKAIEKGKKVRTECILDTVMTHDQNLGNYIWLHPHYGKVLFVEFEEPINSGEWKLYDRYWWGRHGAAISHHPEDLYEEHIKTFVDPSTKTINLRFTFERPTGEVYTIAPTPHFYQLEAEYFSRWKLCQL